MLTLGAWHVVTVQNVVHIGQRNRGICSSSSRDHLLHERLEFLLDGLGLLLDILVSDSALAPLVVENASDLFNVSLRWIGSVSLDFRHLQFLLATRVEKIHLTRFDF